MMSEIIVDPTRRAPSKIVLPSSFSSSHGFRGHDGVPFEQYHRRNDPVMVPDRGFTKQLKALDPELDVVWDWVNQIWCIWCFPREEGRKPYHVMNVCTAGKGYRELGQDILTHLCQINQSKYDTKAVLAYIDEHNNQLQRRKMQDFRAKIQAVVLDTFNFARGVLQVQVPRSLRIGEALK
jgi:hypothetical protein